MPSGTPPEVVMQFVPPKGPSEAELRIHAMRETIGQMPIKEQEDIRYVMDRIDFLRQKFGAQADYAIVMQSLVIAKERGQ